MSGSLEDRLLFGHVDVLSSVHVGPSSLSNYSPLQLSLYTSHVHRYVHGKDKKEENKHK